MAKTKFNVRLDDLTISELDARAEALGVTVSELIRDVLDGELAKTDADLTLEALYELRARIDQRIAQKEAERIQKPPDLVLIVVDSVRGTKMKVERAKAIEAGVVFEEIKRKTR